MSDKNQDFRVSKDSSSEYWSHKELSRTPLKWITAIILTTIYILQTSFIYFEGTLKSFQGSTPYREDLLLSASNFVLTRKVVTINRLTGWQIFWLIAITLYLILILSVISVLLIKWLRRYKISHWIAKYQRTISSVHFYCLSLPIHNIITEELCQAFPLSDARLWNIFIFGLLALIINLAGCLMLFYGPINTNSTDPLAIISDHFLKFTCVQRVIMSLINLLVFQQEVLQIPSAAVNVIYLALALIHGFLFFYTLPFYEKFIFNMFLFGTGISILLDISNIILNIDNHNTFKDPALFVLVFTSIIMPIYMKLALNWRKSRLQMTFLAAFNFRFFGERKQYMNKYWFLQSVYELKPIIEFEYAQGIIPKIYPNEILKKLGLIKQWMNLEKNAPNRVICEMKYIIPMIMNTWRTLCPKDHLVSIILAELMVDEFNLIYEPYVILEEVLKNNIKKNLKFRALEIQGKIQKSLYNNARNANQDLDLATFFDVFQASVDLRHKIISQIEESSHFYQSLQSNNIDLFSIMKSNQKLQILKNSVTRSWNSIPTQFQESTGTLLLIRGLYELYMNFEYKQGKELLDTYDRIFKKKSSLIGNPEIDNETLFSPDNVTIFISTEKSSMGNIVYCSKNSSQILGRKSKSLVGQNVRILMPQFFQEIHNFFIQRKLTTSENILQTIHSQQFALDEKGFVVPVNILITVYPWINKGFLFAGIIRKVKTQSKYIMLDEQGNISGYSKILLPKLNLPQPGNDQKTNILQICGSSETFEKLSVEGPVRRPQGRSTFKLNTLSLERFASSDPVDFKDSKAANPGLKLSTEVSSFPLNSSTILENKSKKDIALTSKVLMEKEIMNFCEFNQNTGINKYLKKIKLQLSKRSSSRESTGDVSPRKFETVQPSQYALSAKQMQYYCTVTINTFADRTVKILQLDDVVLSADDNVHFQQKLLNINKARSPRNQTSLSQILPQKNTFSSFFQVAGAHLRKKSSSPRTSNPDPDDSCEVIEDNNFVEDKQTTSEVRRFFMKDQNSLKSPDENTNSDTYRTSRISEMNLMPLETNRRLIDQTQSDMAQASSRYYNHQDATRDFRITLNTASEFDRLAQEAQKFAVKPRKKLNSPGKDMSLFESTEKAYVDSKIAPQDFANFTPKTKAKVEHFDLKLAITKLPVKKFSEMKIPLISVVISLAVLLAASIFAYNFAVNKLPIIQQSFSGLRSSLNHIISLADINYSMSGLTFYINYLTIPSYLNTFLAYQQDLKTKLAIFNKGNTELLERVDLFSQNYRDFIYKKSIKIYTDDYQNYTSTTNFMYLDTIPALNLISNRATQIALLPTSQKTVIKSNIDFLIYNMFNDLLLQSQEEPGLITQEIQKFIGSVATVSNVVLIFVPCLFGMTIILMILAFIKSYLNLRNFLQNFAYFHPNHINEILADMEWLKDLVSLNSSEKNSIRPAKIVGQNVNTNNAKIHHEKVIKTKQLKIFVLTKLPLIILLLVIPITIVVPSQKTFASNFQSITPTLSTIIKPKELIVKTLLLVVQLGMRSNSATYRVYDQNVSIVIDNNLNELTQLLSEAAIPTTEENYALLHTDFCPFLNATNYQSCKNLFNGASSSGIIGSISTILDFLKFWKTSIDTKNSQALGSIVSSGNIRNSYNLTLYSMEAINYVENQRAEQTSANFKTIERSNTVFIILSILVALIFCVYGVIYVYFPSRKRRSLLCRLVLLFPLSVILANHRLKLYLRKNASLTANAKSGVPLIR